MKGVVNCVNIIFLVHSLSPSKTLKQPPCSILQELGTLRPQANILGIAIDDIESRYQHFRETLTESAQQVLPEVVRTPRQKWMSAPILQKMEQRRLAKMNVALYNFMDREIRQDCRRAKETMLTGQCLVIEQRDAAHKSNLMHSQIGDW